MRVEATLADAATGRPVGTVLADGTTVESFAPDGTPDPDAADRLVGYTQLCWEKVRPAPGVRVPYPKRLLAALVYGPPSYRGLRIDTRRLD